MNYWGCWNDRNGAWDHPESGEDAWGYAIPMTLASAKAHVEASRGNLELAGFGGAWLPIFDSTENSVEGDILKALGKAEAEAREFAAELAKKPPYRGDPLIRCIFR